MTQLTTRPERWENATNRANDALYELQELRDEMIAACEKFEDRWLAMRDSFETAVRNFLAVQRQYRASGVP